MHHRRLLWRLLRSVRSRTTPAKSIIPKWRRFILPSRTTAKWGCIWPSRTTNKWRPKWRTLRSKPTIKWVMKRLSFVSRKRVLKPWRKIWSLLIWIKWWTTPPIVSTAPRIALVLKCTLWRIMHPRRLLRRSRLISRLLITRPIIVHPGTRTITGRTSWWLPVS